MAGRRQLTLNQWRNLTARKAAPKKRLSEKEQRELAIAQARAELEAAKAEKDALAEKEAALKPLAEGSAAEKKPKRSALRPSSGARLKLPSFKLPSAPAGSRRPAPEQPPYTGPRRRRGRWAAACGGHRLSALFPREWA